MKWLLGNEQLKNKSDMFARIVAPFLMTGSNDFVINKSEKLVIIEIYDYDLIPETTIDAIEFYFRNIFGSELKLWESFNNESEGFVFTKCFDSGEYHFELEVQCTNE